MQQLADEIARSSEGWPQHVRTEAAAAFRAIGQKKGEIKDIEILPMRALARKYRQRSYEARQSKEMKEAKDLVAAVMEEVPSNGGLSRSRVLNAIKGKIANGQGTEWELPEGMSAGQFLGHLIHRGALQPGSGDGAGLPHPQLAHMVDRPATCARGDGGFRPYGRGSPGGGQVGGVQGCRGDGRGSGPKPRILSSTGSSRGGSGRAPGSPAPPPGPRRPNRGGRGAWFGQKNDRFPVAYLAAIRAVLFFLHVKKSPERPF